MKRTNYGKDLKNKSERHKGLSRMFKNYELSEARYSEIEEKREKYDEWLKEIGSLE